MHNRKISVIGLGYVGLPVAVSFGRHNRVVGFDINGHRLDALRNGHDATDEVSDQDLAVCDVHYTSEPADLKAADFHIVTVPTPIDESKRPDLTPLQKASEMLGRVIKPGDIVVYESTVYPGATEEVCVPILEAKSGLTWQKDFHVGYSPERINPGDKVHRFETITKVVSGDDAETLDIVASVYGSVVTAGIHKAASLKTAEAAKVIENTQRDVNIALMNELALIFDRMGIDTRDVLDAAGTKWNFLKFHPGLVGGHCIGVDPYYLTHKAETVGYHPDVILSGRRVNDEIGRHVARKVVRSIMQRGIQGARVIILGLTFKEDVPDIRNTRVVDILTELQEFGVQVQVHDPLADPKEVIEEYGFQLTDRDDLEPAHAVVLASSHKLYLDTGWELVQDLLENGVGFVADVRGGFDRETVPNGIDLWRL